jgi:ergothioneine biosynthesis protein EgtB
MQAIFDTWATGSATAPTGCTTAATLTLAERYDAVRARTDALVAALQPEDMQVQSMPDASPAKWHLAHTTWFFETFLLGPNVPGYTVFDTTFGYLFNSYYEAVGPRHPRPTRGLVTRPGIDGVRAYRTHVDAHMRRFIAEGLDAEREALLRLGLAHEEQHQELLVMDVQHLFAQSPLKPAFDPAWPATPAGPAGRYRHVAGGPVRIGATDEPFAFDNESPRHTAWLEPFQLADRLVTNGQWLAFMALGGYRRAELWLSDGWAQCQAEGWEAPQYWQREDDTWFHMTPGGWKPVDPDAAVMHVSYYEADAYARWAGARLPTEAEWEHAAARTPADGNFADADRLHPGRAPAAAAPAPADALAQLFGDVWEWTSSSYSPYPGFRPLGGALGEYNGKFMSGQHVLRGGSCLTPAGHVRRSYRNFFPPGARWQMTGVRLAADG